MRPSFGRVFTRLTSAAWLAAGIAGPATPLAAQLTDDRTERAEPPRASGWAIEQPPTIDGVLEDAVWRDAPVLSNFVQREPFEGRPSTERTEVRILYDDAALYLGAWMYDRDVSAIVYGETRRDADLDNVDALLFIFDTFYDRQNGFVFGTTPAGIEYDGQVTREGEGGGRPSRGQRQQSGSGGGFNKNWDGSWQVATSIDDRGWYAELRIPFSTLRYARGGEQQWGLNIARNIRRKNEEAFWAPIRRQHDLYRVSDAGTLSGIQAPTRRTVEITPYVLASGHKDYLAQTDADYDGDVGGDAKIGLTPSLALDLTVNTDFAQVEADDEQINLTRFPLFFPEKRPFFLENAGVFSVGTPQEVELFFSRRIGREEGAAVPIMAGGRVSGKVGGVTLGAMNLQTDQVDRFDADSGRAIRLVDRNNYSVLRLLKELPNRTRFGGIAVSRLNTSDTDDYNLTYGVDGRLGIGDALTFDGYAAFSRTAGLGGGEHAFSVGGNYNDRDWTVAGTFREVSADFNPEVGFLPRRAYRFVSGRILRRLRFESIDGWFRELRPHISLQQYADLDGFIETRLLHIDSHFEFANGAFFQLPALNFTREGLTTPFEIADGIVVPPGTYDNFEWGFAYNTNLSAPVSFQGRIEIGGFYSGRRKGTTTTFNFRFDQTAVASVRVEYFDVDLAEGSFETALASLRLSYAFTPRIYLQSLLQYNDQTRDFSSNIRFGWLNTAGTGLFVVYNDIEHTGPFDRTGIESGPVDRALIVKFTHRFFLLQ